MSQQKIVSYEMPLLPCCLCGAGGFFVFYFSYYFWPSDMGLIIRHEIWSWLCVAGATISADAPEQSSAIVILGQKKDFFTKKKKREKKSR